MGYKEIYARYRQQILAGQLKPGDRVPAIRTLASELRVARKTVEAAYEILIGEGYFVSQGAKGTRVNPELILAAAAEEAVLPAPPASDVSLREPKGELRLGIPALDEFPHKKWLLISGKAARTLRADEMILPPIMGYQPLREAIASYLNISRGLNCQPEQIFITSGYRANLRLILAVLAQPSDKVMFEDPGYFFGQKLLKRIAPNLHYVPVDRQGMDVDYLLRYHADARFAIVTPTHHSPLAVTLSLPRKHQLLEWAQHNESWIIEDDYDGEFHYTRKVIPALKSLDVHDRVIYTGTFSKTMMPAMRVGYLVMPKETIARFSELGEILETGMSLLPQKILAQFLSEGHFYRHIKKMRTLYQQRRRMMLDALQACFPDVFDFELTDGGMHIVAFLPRGTQDAALAEIWQRHQLRVLPLSGWYMQTQKRYGLVMGYTNIRSVEQAQELLQRTVQETRALLG
ncbi:GntR family transcriptional regulator / MocR family aminotransferase [Candidatus Pantoea symbiotica]|uniref:GntR family transcriptional regulator / MocR family aminotransferase n=1 Tax=Candidatus Pantoea symbiotica TaxID=1884370 RepID=A0A1I3XJF3_9GAMM|nr:MULTISPECIES: PLP-dependent aminotransferase family protein [Pantoea]KAJ9434353.1 PLP-dependent aminotransferase family protein [Pantoea sp. YR343]SFK19717.1 GntR family transcriptional regulator / MocR family aminotransferase [Pantoea symbiotica]SFU80216.1 GntR family transcriptional regulator / MocR family aminotransferase [Pantoea sp. YR525]